MADLLSQPVAELCFADYRVYRFTDQLYKVNHFKSTAPRGVPLEHRQRKGNKVKLDPSLSRARRAVLELALCNDWKYFCTFTISGEKWDRKDLIAWHGKFSQWLRDQRKKYRKLGFNFDIYYVLVPEQHEDGSWHMHGLFSDITPVLVSFAELLARGYNVPVELAKDGYLNWVDYQMKFGFCSFGVIRDKIKTAFYVSKYISKQLQDTCVSVGLHTYYPARGLNHATLHGEVYGNCGYLDQFIQYHYDFVDTGMTSAKDGCTWNFAFEYMDVDAFEAFALPDQEDDPDVDAYFEAVQAVLDGF